MANELPYCPFFVGDFLVTVSTWPVDRVGAYQLALWYQWEQGGLPADDEKELAGILHATRPVARRLWTAIKAKFQRREDGLYWNARLELVRIQARQQVAGASDRGKKGAAARWGKGAHVDAMSMAQAMPKHSPSNGNQSKNQNQITPPNPPLPGGQASRRSISGRERQKAEDFLRSRGGYCPHTPRCANGSVCVGKLVQGWREHEAQGQAEVVEVE